MAQTLCDECKHHFITSEINCECAAGLEEAHRIACIEGQEKRKQCRSRLRGPTGDKRGAILRQVRNRTRESLFYPWHIGNRLYTYTPAKDGKLGRGGVQDKDL